MRQILAWLDAVLTRVQVALQCFAVAALLVGSCASLLVVVFVVGLLICFIWSLLFGGH